MLLKSYRHKLWRNNNFSKCWSNQLERLRPKLKFTLNKLKNCKLQRRNQNKPFGKYYKKRNKFLSFSLINTPNWNHWSYKYKISKCNWKGETMKEIFKYIR